MSESLRDELKPVGAMENLFVEQIIASTWRLRRLGRVEAGIFALDYHETMTGQTQEALTSQEEMKTVRDSELITLAQTFVDDAGMANAFSKLSRYEAPIERSHYRALHELQRLQAARHAGSNVSPPVALDVDVSSGLSKEDL